MNEKEREEPEERRMKKIKEKKRINAGTRRGQCLPTHRTGRRVFWFAFAGYVALVARHAIANRNDKIINPARRNATANDGATYPLVAACACLSHPDSSLIFWAALDSKTRIITLY